MVRGDNDNQKRGHEEETMFGTRQRRYRLLHVLVLAGMLGSFASLTALSTARAADTPFTVLASGLDSPRGLAFGPEGALYVAEAGRGGTGPCLNSPEGGQACYGASGAVTRIWRGTQQRLATGLP